MNEELKKLMGDKRLSRPDYERLCAEYELECRDDSKVEYYADTGFAYWSEQPARVLCQFRWWALRDERKAAGTDKPAPTPPPLPVWDEEDLMEEGEY